MGGFPHVHNSGTGPGPRGTHCKQLTWLALGHDHAGGSRSAEQVIAL